MKLKDRIMEINEKASQLNFDLIHLKNKIILHIRQLPDINGKPIEWNPVSGPDYVVVMSNKLRYNWSAEYFIFRHSYQWMINEIEKARNDNLIETLDIISCSNSYNKDGKPVYTRVGRGGNKIQLHEKAVENFKQMLEKL